MTNPINYCILYVVLVDLFAFIVICSNQWASAIIQEMVSELPLLHNKLLVQIKALTIFGKIQDWY